MVLAHNTASGMAVGTYGTWTEALGHLNFVDSCAVGTDQQRRVEGPAELDIDQVYFPAHWAVSGVLRAH